MDLISKYFSRGDAKAWEGYLVLVTLEDPIANDYTLDRIRRDTTRVRKLIITGRSLSTIEGVRSALLPLLPLFDINTRAGMERITDRLPGLLSRQGVPEDLAVEVVRAFNDNRSPMEAVWRWQVHNETSET